MLQVIKTVRGVIDEFPISKDTLLYTTDTKETFFDLNFEERMQIKTGLQFRDEDQIFAIPNPNSKKLYISVKSNKLYRWFDNKYIEVKERAQLVDLLISMIEMKPVVLTEGNNSIAPRTLMSNVYSNDGRTLEEIIEERNGDKYTYIFTSRVVLEAKYDYQKVFTIPFPIPGYDIKKSPIEIVFGDSEYVRPNQYTISENQLIFSEVFAQRIIKGNLITLIFHYSETYLHDDKINANLINGRYVIFSDTEPIDMKPGDIWFNTNDRVCLEKTPQGWKDILNPEDIDYLTSNIIVSAEDMEIPINIDGFDKKTDSLDVYRNGLLYTNEVDYKISDDNKTITLTNPNVFIIQNEMHTFVFKAIKNGLPRKVGVNVINNN